MTLDQRLILNAGNSFDRDSPYTGIAAEYIVKMLALSGVEVIGIGPTELQLGDKKLRQVLAKSSVDMVSANLPAYLPYLRLNKCGGRCRVLVTSVIDPGVLESIGIRYSGELTDPVAALKKLQKEIKHDLFIVIIHAMEGRTQEIAKNCGGIDLVIDGLTRGITDNFSEIGEVPVVINNRRGQYITYTDFKSGPGKGRFTTPVGLRASIHDTVEDPEIKKLAEEYNAAKNEYARKLREERSRQRMMRRVPNLYLGQRACEQCHAEAAAKWRETRHAEAYLTLEKKGRMADVECLRCHVTGMDDREVIGGFSSIDENPWMVNVQCESCHGPGANHVQQPRKNKMKMGSKIDCKHCHTYVSDPDFDFGEKMKLIEHKAILK